MRLSCLLEPLLALRWYPRLPVLEDVQQVLGAVLFPGLYPYSPPPQKKKKKNALTRSLVLKPFITGKNHVRTYPYLSYARLLRRVNTYICGCLIIDYPVHNEGWPN